MPFETKISKYGIFEKAVHCALFGGGVLVLLSFIKWIRLSLGVFIFPRAYALCLYGL